MQEIDIYLLGCGFFFVSSLLMAFFFHKKLLSPLKELKINGRRASAKIIEKYTSSGKHGTIYNVKYSYHDDKGQDQEGKTSITSEEYEKCEEGDDISIRFLKQNPKFSRADRAIDRLIASQKIIVGVLYFEAFIVAPALYFILTTMLKK